MTDMAVVGRASIARPPPVRASGRVQEFIDRDGQRCASEPGEVDLREEGVRHYPLTIAADDFTFYRQHLNWSQ